LFGGQWWGNATAWRRARELVHLSRCCALTLAVEVVACSRADREKRRRRELRFRLRVFCGVRELSQPDRACALGKIALPGTAGIAAIAACTAWRRAPSWLGSNPRAIPGRPAPSRTLSLH